MKRRVRHERNPKLLPVKLTKHNVIALKAILDYGIDTEPEPINHIAARIKSGLRYMNKYLHISMPETVILTCITTAYLHDLDWHYLKVHQPKAHRNQVNPLYRNLHHHKACRVIHDHLLCQCNNNPKARKEIKALINP